MESMGANAPAPGRAAPSFLRLVGRAALAAAVLTAAAALLQHQAGLFKEGRFLVDPLSVALKARGISVVESDILVTARLREGPPPTFSELKAIAEQLAARMPAGERSLWSDAGSGYAAVYVEGAEPEGGRWVASARYIPGTGDSGRVEASVRRRFYGLPEGLARLVRWTEQAVLRAAGPSSPLEGKAVFQGRPAGDEPREQLAAGLLGELGAAVRYQELAGDRYVAAGWTPKLPGRTAIGGQAVNVTVTVRRHGQGEWVEVETPIL